LPVNSFTRKKNYRDRDPAGNLSRINQTLIENIPANFNFFQPEPD